MKLNGGLLPIFRACAGRSTRTSATISRRRRATWRRPWRRSPTSGKRTKCVRTWKTKRRPTRAKPTATTKPRPRSTAPQSETPSSTVICRCWPVSISVIATAPSLSISFISFLHVFLYFFFPSLSLSAHLSVCLFLCFVYWWLLLVDCCAKIGAGIFPPEMGDYRAAELS